MGDLERDDALARIRRRHERVDDPRWSEACADSDDAARAVLDYLRRYRGRFPRQVVQDDVWDELVLAAWVYWDERRREHELLNHALTRGLSLREVGAFVGLHSAQGLRDHLDSVEARLVEHRRLTRQLTGSAVAESGRTGYSPTGHSPTAHSPTADVLAPSAGGASSGSTDGAAPDDPGPRRSRNPYLRFEGRSRADRGADGKFIRARRAAARARPTRERWVEDHHDRITAVLTRLLHQVDRVLPSVTEAEPEVTDPTAPTEYLQWLREDLDDDDVTATTLVSAGLALNTVRLLPAVTGLARNHALHRALSDADRLRADFAALTPH